MDAPEMPEKRYEPCPYCREARAEGHIPDCYECKGRGMVRIPSTYVCNACGGPLCPNVDSPNSRSPHGLVEARVGGGYDSPALSDMEEYEFSLCETCLRALFARFVIPPRTWCRMSGAEPYAVDAERYAERLWRESGGQNERLRAGLCNATRHCTAPATWRRFLSDYLTDDTMCDEHRTLMGSQNARFVPFAEISAIGPNEPRGTVRTADEYRLIADVWLKSHISGAEPSFWYWLYLPTPIADLLGLNEDPHERGQYSFLWSPVESALPDGKYEHRIEILGGVGIVDKNLPAPTTTHPALVSFPVRRPFEEELARIRAPEPDEEDEEG